MNYTVARYVTQHSQCSSVQSLAYFAMSFTPQLALQDRQVTERSAPEVDPQPSGNRQEKSRGSYLPKEKRPALRGSAEKLSKNGLFSRQTRIYHR